MQHLIVHMRENFAHVFVARMIEWEHAIGLIGFGAVLILQPSLIETAPGYAAFHALRSSADFWGLAAMIAGALRFVVLFFNGTIRRSPHLRAAFAMISAGFWFLAAYGAVVAGTLSPVTLLYVSMVGWEFVIFLLCMRYAKLEDIGAVRRAAKPDA